VSATHKERRHGQWPGHHDQVPVTNSCCLICRVVFSFCNSAAWPQPSAWVPAGAPR
jgi:hypothetical protein